MNILLLGLGRPRTCACLEACAIAELRQLVAAPGNPGIARWAELRRDRPVRPRRGASTSHARTPSTSSSSGPRRRWSTGLPTRCGRRASASSARARPRPQLEGSKGFTKDLCRATASPPRAYARASIALATRRRRSTDFGLPVVIKADGLAAGKGVTVAMTSAEAEAAIEARRGDGPLVIEEFLEGEEASFFALVDGDDRRPVRLGPGPQARRRRRHRPQYRRHGRLCARPDPHR